MNKKIGFSFSPMWTDAVKVYQAEVLQLHPEPDLPEPDQN